MLLLAEKCERTLYEKSRYGVSRTIAEHEKFDRLNFAHIQKEQTEYRQKQEYIKAHLCPICKKSFDYEVPTETIKLNRTVIHLTGCPECIANYKTEIDKAQSDKRDTFNYKTDAKPTGRKFNEYDEAEYPHTIELIIHGWDAILDSDKTITVNGNYKAGMIKDFIKTDRKKVKI